MRSRGIVSLLAVGGALFATSAAHAATLSVDDDGEDCPAAAFSSVQAALDAANAGDTVAICPGAYREGSGAVGSNGLTISRSVTIRGAGADLVRIAPRRSTASGGQIARDIPSLRDASGDVVSVAGGTAIPITVDISGVTIDGGGVYVEAGVVYRDAQGTISRSRVTNVVTTEAADAYATTAGAWRGPQPGYGIAHVTAAGATPPGATARTLTIQNTRVDRYNRAGVFIEGLADAGAALVDNRGVINASEIVGRVLCQNFAADGNCSAPGLVTTGPLFGQDGVQVSGLARATVQGSTITQNLVNGTGAPVRQTFSQNGTPQNPGTDGNANLSLAAGIRLTGADAANSLITKNNIIDNGYGVHSTGATAPVPAPNNWWGLRFTPPPTNTGPAISPAFNPPIPENPVNGAPVVTAGGTTSSTVDFLPFRAGAQSDPTAGQFPNVQAPQPVSDAAPTITLAADRATVNRGEVVTLTATAADDFGVKRVTFRDGATAIGTDRTAPYTAAFTVPADAPCAERTLSALVEDSLGQTASATAKVTVVGPNNCQPPGPDPVPPTGSLPHSLNMIAQGGTNVTVTASSPAGIAKVEFLLGDRLVCTVTAAPYTCKVVPKAADIGLQSLRVVITGRDGLTTVLERQVLIRRFKSRGVDVKIQYTRVSKDKERRTIIATVLPPAGVTAAEACQEGAMTFVVNREGEPFINTQRRLKPDCTARISFEAKRASGHSSKAKKKHSKAKRRRTKHDAPDYSVGARFGGNTVLLPASTFRRFA